MKIFSYQIESLGFKISKCKKYAYSPVYGLIYGKTNTEKIDKIKQRLLEYHN